MYLIIGLGNPGKKYHRTRHNTGFFILDALQQQLSFPAFQPHRSVSAEISIGNVERKKIILAKPNTFMNQSGIAVKQLMQQYKIPIAKICVIHDDKDLSLGSFKVQFNRGDAGHNGVKSVIEHLGSKDFLRIRVGIARESMHDVPTEEFVLKPFSPNERSKTVALIPQIMSAIQEWSTTSTATKHDTSHLKNAQKSSPAGR